MVLLIFKLLFILCLNLLFIPLGYILQMGIHFMIMTIFMRSPPLGLICLTYQFLFSFKWQFFMDFSPLKLFVFIIMHLLLLVNFLSLDLIFSKLNFQRSITLTLGLHGIAFSFLLSCIMMILFLKFSRQ